MFIFSFALHYLTKLLYYLSICHNLPIKLDLIKLFLFLFLTLLLRWMKTTWNQMIAPRVREAVKRGTGSEAASEGQQKVANTALYVLMQRSVILGCPLAGQGGCSFFYHFPISSALLKSDKSHYLTLQIIVSNTFCQSSWYSIVEQNVSYFSCFSQLNKFRPLILQCLQGSQLFIFEK